MDASSELIDEFHDSRRKIRGIFKVENRLTGEMTILAGR